MNEQAIESPVKRGPGRPRKVRTELVAPPQLQPQPQPSGVFPLVTDRRGVARMIGKSISSIKRLERNDPEWPKPFAIGGHEHNYLIADIEMYLMTKARGAQDSRTSAS
ncbi:hypothetical protein [Paraburkholderia hospita]|jgi:predicted DNA-binding transcriptional regulator AlpA|uniref:hypothetical protein n=1 Tax=Paraburkholderia hospita TaxID=169430 RepID=UPI000DEFE16F|nr:hypothetical protein [Paraburkholderia hospita]AXF01528.1 hypothetical protein CUJ88_24110 [Paraburkholderia hospita]